MTNPFGFQKFKEKQRKLINDLWRWRQEPSPRKRKVGCSNPNMNICIHLHSNGIFVILKYSKSWFVSIVPGNELNRRIVYIFVNVHMISIHNDVVYFPFVTNPLLHARKSTTSDINTLFNVKSTCSFFLPFHLVILDIFCMIGYMK